MSESIGVFISYASQDDRFLKKLLKYLVPLERDRFIQVWAAVHIRAGMDRRRTIDTHLNTAQIILLLISPDFIGSSSPYKVEMAQAMERYNRGEAQVIPIILRTTPNWQNEPFGNIQALPQGGKAITTWSNEDDAFASVVNGIRDAIKQPIAPSSPGLSVPPIVSRVTNDDIPIPPQKHLGQGPDLDPTPITSLVTPRSEKENSSPPLAISSRSLITRRRVVASGVGVGVATVLVGLGYILSHPTHHGFPSTPVPSRGTTLLTYHGHKDAVSSVMWSPSNKHIASASMDQTAQIWDPVTGHTEVTYKGHSNSIQAVAWSPDEKYVASGSADHTVHIWDATNGQRITSYSGHVDSVDTVAWSPDGTRIASGSHDRTVHIWNPISGHIISIYRHHAESLAGFVKSVAWSPNGIYIASGDANNRVRVWNAGTGEDVYIYSYTSDQSSVAWSPDGKRIASASPDHTVQVWDAFTGGNVLISTGHADEVDSVAWSPDGKYLASGSKDHTVRVWNATTTDDLSLVYKGHFDEVLTVAWAHDSRRIASGSQDHTIQIWQAV